MAWICSATKYQRGNWRLAPSLKKIIGLALLFLVVSCEQFEYSSPLPGVLEIRLGVANNRQTLIPFGPQSRFGLTLRSLEAKRPGGTRLPIFSDLHAIRRNPDGDYFNCLDTLARDSASVLGQVYAPPGTFTALEFTVSPDPIVFILYGFYSNIIGVVVRPQFQDLQRLPAPGDQLNIRIEESRLTRVTVTLDLDSSLVQRTETFEYVPRFHVSSVEIF